VRSFAIVIPAKAPTTTANAPELNYLVTVGPRPAMARQNANEMMRGLFVDVKAGG
jgi:hypothetical protein